MLTKKENYLTEHFCDRCRDLLAPADGPNRRPRLQFRPPTSALLVLDMQRFFLDRNSHAFIPAAPAIVPPIAQLIDAYHHAHRPIFFTQHLNTDNNAQLMSKWWRDLIRPQDPLAPIIDDLDTSTGAVIVKSQYDAFYQTNLADLLQANHITQLIICGVMTNLCCETTARSAFVQGFEVFFPVDAAAAYNADFHLASLKNLAFGFAQLITSADITRCLEGHRAD